jgi:hypothetical protein
MKKIYIKCDESDEVYRCYLFDLDKNIQYFGSKKIGSYSEKIDDYFLKDSHFISDEKFNEMLELKFSKIFKMNKMDFIKKYSFEEIIIKKLI